MKERDSGEKIDEQKERTKGTKGVLTGMSGGGGGDEEKREDKGMGEEKRSDMANYKLVDDQELKMVLLD